MKHNVRRKIFKNEDRAPAKTVRGSLVRYAYPSLPGFVSMFTCIGGKVAPSSDLNIFIGLYVHVCSGEKAGIVGEYRGSDSLLEVKRGSYSSLFFRWRWCSLFIYIKTLCLLCFKFSATWPLSRNK